MAALIGMSPSEVMSHIGAGLAVLAVTFTLFACGWIGGGDAKLAAATALWLGFAPLMDYLLIASIFGGVLTLFIMRFRLMPLPAMLQSQEWAHAAAPRRCRRALRHRARGGRDDRLSAHDLDEAARAVSCARDAVIQN